LLVFAAGVMNVIVAEIPAQGAKQMRAFTIDETNAITVHETRKAAKAIGAEVFTSEVELADLIGPDSKRLVEIYNSIPGTKPVSKFTNRKVATERIWKTIQGLGGREAKPATEPVQEAPAETTDTASVPETPFDPIETSPDPAAGEHRAAIETAAAKVEDEPASAATESGAQVPTAGAQEPNVAPDVPEFAHEDHPRQEGPQSADGSQGGEGRRSARE
jgi:hypothetical protein